MEATIPMPNAHINGDAVEQSAAAYFATGIDKTIDWHVPNIEATYREKKREKLLQNIAHRSHRIRRCPRRRAIRHHTLIG